MENKDLISNSLSEQLKEANKTLPNITNFISQHVDPNLFYPLSHIIPQSFDPNLFYPLQHIISQHFKQTEELYKNIPQLNYEKAFSDYINEVFLKLEEDENVNLKDIDKNEIEEFKNDLYEINKEKVVPLNWQQKIFDVYKKWAEKNPVIAAILSIVVASIISFYLSILLPVRKNANSNSQIINQTTINNITIIDEVKYYYKVQTIDNEGNIINGYVTKRKYNKLKSNKTVEK